MPVQKLSIALDRSVAQRAASAAQDDGLSLSAWLNRAAENYLAVRDGLLAVREWEAEHGSLTRAELAAADALLDTFTGAPTPPIRRPRVRRRPPR